MWRRFLFFIFFCMCTLFAAEVIIVPKISEDVKKEGKLIYNKECYACHRFTRDFAGPRMDENIKKYEAKKEDLVRYLMKPTPKNPDKYPPMTLEPLSQEMAQVISSWLFYLLTNPNDPDRPR